MNCACNLFGFMQKTKKLPFISGSIRAFAPLPPKIPSITLIFTDNPFAVFLAEKPASMLVMFMSMLEFTNETIPVVLTLCKITILYLADTLFNR